MKEFKVEVLEEICKGCTLCVTSCPRQLFKISTSLNSKGYNPTKWLGHPAFLKVEEVEKLKEENNQKFSNLLSCAGCQVCYNTCPEAAIKIYKKREEGVKILEE